MRYLLCFLAMLLCLLTPVSAQIPVNEDAYSDSLSTLLSHTRPDSAKARICYLLADAWAGRDSARAQRYLQQAATLSGSNPYLRALAPLYTAMSCFQRNPAKAEGLFMEAEKQLKGFSSKEAFLFRAKLWTNYGILQQIKGNTSGYLKILMEQAIPYAQRSGNEGLLANIYTYVAHVFKEQGYYRKAEDYYTMAFQLFEKDASYEQALVFACLSAAETYLLDSNTHQAGLLLTKVRNKLRYGPPSRLKATFYKINGEYLIRREQYRDAISSLDSGVLIAKASASPSYTIRNMLIEKYKALKASGQYRQAKEQLLRTVKAYPPLPTNRIVDAYELADIYALTGDMRSAYQWQKEYGRLSDSIYDSKLRNELSELDLKYRTAEKEKSIIRLQSEKDKALLTARNHQATTWFLGAVSLLLLVTLVLVFLFYRNKKRTLAQQEQIRMAQAMLTAQEEERTRIARDLHDGLGGMLAGVKISLSGLAHDGEERIDAQALHSVTSQLDHSITELRHIAHNMMPEILLKLGLETALGDLCGSLQRYGLSIRFQSLGIQNDIPREKQVTIYRIAQELLNNIVKHAQARNVLFQCSQNGSVFLLTIEDDGKGYTMDRLPAGQGMGLKNIVSRVAYLQGKMEIVPSDHHAAGTAVNIELDVSHQGSIP